MISHILLQPTVYRLDSKDLSCSLALVSLIFFLAGVGRNQVYGACYYAQMAQKPVLTSWAKQKTDAKSLLS